MKAGKTLACFVGVKRGKGREEKKGREDVKIKDETTTS